MATEKRRILVLLALRDAANLSNAAELHPQRFAELFLQRVSNLFEFSRFASDPPKSYDGVYLRIRSQSSLRV